MKISIALFTLSSSVVNAFMVESPAAFSWKLGSSISSAVNGVAKVVAPAPQTFIKPKPTDEIYDQLIPITVQGDTLRTCSFDETVGRVTVYLKTEGRPMNANVELWQGPDNSPQRMSVYLEDGSLRPFRCTIESPGSSNSVSIRNTGQMEYPLIAALEVDISGDTEKLSDVLLEQYKFRTIQGGAVYTTPFPPAVQSVQLCLKTDGRPLKARVELLQGPNNNKQVMEVYTEDGDERPFYVIIATPGVGNVVRIVNTATIEFPLVASIEPYIIEQGYVDSAASGNMVWR